jgi:hypothetical protein
VNTKYQYKRREKSKKLTSASDILYPLLRRYGLDNKLALYEFSEKWCDIVGEVVGNKCTPIYIKGEKLFLEVENSIWAQELSFMKLELLSRVRLYLKNQKDLLPHTEALRKQLCLVNDISFKVASNQRHWK